MSVQRGGAPSFDAGKTFHILDNSAKGMSKMLLKGGGGGGAGGGGGGVVGGLRSGDDLRGLGGGLSGWGFGLHGAGWCRWGFENWWRLGLDPYGALKW